MGMPPTLRTMVLAAGLVSVLGVEAGATPFLMTDFNGRTVSGATASNLTWTVYGVADPGALTADFPLFNTPDAQDKFVAQRNIGNQGPWRVRVPLGIGAFAIPLGLVTLDAFIFNNGGSLQPANRDLDMTVSLLDSSLAVIDSATVNNIYPEDGLPPVQPQAVSFDLSGNTLGASTNYWLDVFVFSQSQGNNAGFDNFSVFSETEVAAAVPEAGSFALLATGLVFSAVRWRKRRPAA